MRVTRRTFGAAMFPWARAAAQQHQAAQVATYVSDVDDTDQPYALYVPKSYSASKRYPLVISLHDTDSNHRLNLRRVFGEENRFGEGDGAASRYFPRFRDVEYIVACPLARGSMGYRGIAEKDVYDVIADVKSRYRIDDERIYLTGISAGGGGALWLGLTRPDIWAAIAAVCPAPPEEAEELAGNSLGLPIKLFQGAIDPLVKAEQTRRWYRELVDAGANAEYVEYPAIRHNAWDLAYKNGTIFDWFAAFRRNAQPDRVRYASTQYRYRRSHWIEFDRLTPGLRATLDARFTARNKLSVTTSALDGFSISLRSHPMVVSGRPVAVTVDGAPLIARPGGTSSFSKAGGRWTPKRAVLSAGEKQPGSEGPIREVISTRHVYVYGTADSPSTEELIRRRDMATLAANWSTPARPLLVTFRVVADAEVKNSEVRNQNMVLFGTRESNSVIAKLADSLPMRLNPGAADYGLVFVWPNGKDHSVLINAGLPWWTRADQARRLGMPLLPSPYLILNTLGDFILFRGGLDQVVSEGYFDSHWRLPESAKGKMRGCGAVEMR